MHIWIGDFLVMYTFDDDNYTATNISCIVYCRRRNTNMELINNEEKKDLVATNYDYQFHEEIDMYAQAAIQPNPLLRNGAYGIVMRGVQKCTRGCSSLRGRKRLPLCCIKLDTATDTARVSGLDVMHTLNLLTMGVAENTEMGCLNTWVNTSRRSTWRTRLPI